MASPSSNRRFLKARWILPVATPPVEHGVVELKNDRIVRVFTAEQWELESPELGASQLTDYGEAIIVPGFINLHTHVEWTDIKVTDTKSTLFEWIPQLVKQARGWSCENFLASAAKGVDLIARSGTTCVLDSSYSGQAALALSDYGLRGVVALELFGMNKAQATATWQKWLERYEALHKQVSHNDKIVVTVAPHAPYTVCPELMQLAVSWANQAKLPVTTHLAESEIELNWFKTHEANLDRFIMNSQLLTENDLTTLPYRNSDTTPVMHLAENGLLHSRLVAAHAVEVSDQDIQTLAKHGVSVATCPRSNARLGNGIAPLSRLISGGVRVGFGTDSLASNESLDILDEVRFATNCHETAKHQFPLSSEQTIKALTQNAAAALGMAELLGTLEPGKMADLAIFNIASTGASRGKSPYDALVDGNVVLQEVMVGGRKVASNGLY